MTERGQERAGAERTTYVHVYAPKPTGRFVLSGTCRDCKRRTRFIGLSYEWYDASVTCLRCGRRWEDGEWMPLEFERGARRNSIERAKRAFRRAHLSQDGEG